jgi:cell wall-associated NlpC family hydrolase
MRPRPHPPAGLRPTGHRELRRRHRPDAAPRRNLAPRHSTDGRPSHRPTAAGYATDGDADGLADIWNPADAIAGAARLLQANGAPADYRKAIFAYNHADWYVNDALAKADEYRGAFAVGSTPAALTVLSWAVAHVGRCSYELGGHTDRGGSITEMRGQEPKSTTCDCSMFVRWAYAQVGIDPGLTTVTQWTANGRLPSHEVAATSQLVARGVGPTPSGGGYRPGDLIFFRHGEGALGHVALWIGRDMIVQCSSSGNGSNIRPLAGYVRPTGWLRWRVLTR